MMGAIAKSVLDHGGEVTGIIPEFLVAREHAMNGADNLIVTRDMHERKRKMFEMADAFVAMPGGIGTLEEVVEQITWVQLGRHRKPVLLANIKNFWDPLCALIDHMKKLEFIRGDLDFDLLVADKVEDILPMLQKAAATCRRSKVKCRRRSDVNATGMHPLSQAIKLRSLTRGRSSLTGDRATFRQ